MKPRFLLLAILPVLSACYQGKCFQCRKFVPDPDGTGTVYVGNDKICPEKDNIYLIDPVPGDSTDLWECEQ